jgi:hypothetical protein
MKYHEINPSSYWGIPISGNQEQRLALQQRVLQLQRSRDNARRKVMEQLRAKA